MTAPRHGQPQPPEYARNYPAPPSVPATVAGVRPGVYEGPPDKFVVRARVTMTAAASFWYVLGCIGFGAAYFAKVPAKKALAEAGLAEMTAAEKFWYVLQCIAFGAGYFAKLPVKKALTEMH